MKGLLLLLFLSVELVAWVLFDLEPAAFTAAYDLLISHSLFLFIW